MYDIWRQPPSAYVGQSPTRPYSVSWSEDVAHCPPELEAVLLPGKDGGGILCEEGPRLRRTEHGPPRLVGGKQGHCTQPRSRGSQEGKKRGAKGAPNDSSQQAESTKNIKPE
jgi:hypothetical protein